MSVASIRMARTRMADKRRVAERLAKQQAATNAGASSSPSSSSTPASVTEPFERALSTLSGADSDAERLYQQGRRQALSQGAISAINAGAANTVNMPAMGIAYDQANRPGFNVGIAAQKAGVLQNLGQTAAGLYATDVGAATSRYSTNVGAATTARGQTLQSSLSQQQIASDFATNQANNALKKYIADLNARTTLAIQGTGQPTTQKLV